ncbi:hypothetical protein OC842_001315 [Tilletia horrida]|uniref:Uncharacterized protein n=1 Tax=Tilletia horrida TaxID=155126 RepID=A0AAN6GI05_9BASI|nr:hypothetical protein OC842_001315 [Tilletia horrida]
MPSPRLGHRPARVSADFFSRSSTADPFQRPSTSAAPSSASIDGIGRSSSSQGPPSRTHIHTSSAAEPSATWYNPSSTRARRPNNISTPPRTSSNDSPRTLTLNDQALQQSQLSSQSQSTREYLAQQDAAISREHANWLRNNQTYAAHSSSSGPADDWTQPAPLWTPDPSSYQIRDSDMERELENDAQALAASASSSSRRQPHQHSRRSHQTEREEQARREREYLAYQRTASLAAEQSYVLQQQYHQQQQVQLQQQQQQQQQQQMQLQQQQQASTSSNPPPAKAAEPRHRVYLLNCKYCGTFLSNRGQKAVLLLEPHITLYSTDSIPFNCGPLYIPPPVERTCDCITHSLGCYGCGAQVGYHIVAPCSRCTSSVANHRSSNGHRTVLHRSEISVRERRYVTGEPGVLAAPYVPQASSSSHANGAVAGVSGSPTSLADLASRHTPSPPSSTIPALPSFTGAASPAVGAAASTRSGSRTIRSASTAGWSSPANATGGNGMASGNFPHHHHQGAGRGPTDFYAGTYRQQPSTALGGGEADKGGDASMQQQQQQHFRDHHLSPPSHSSFWNGTDGAPTIRINGSNGSSSSSNTTPPNWTTPVFPPANASTPSSSSTSSAKPSPSAAAGSSGARVIKRGDVLYWSDLLPEVVSNLGERQVPLDPDVILNQPLAGRFLVFVLDFKTERSIFFFNFPNHI